LDPTLRVSFVTHAAREYAYQMILFAQRRKIHYEVTWWYETAHAGDLSGHNGTLAHHMTL